MMPPRASAQLNLALTRTCRPTGSLNSNTGRFACTVSSMCAHWLGSTTSGTTFGTVEHEIQRHIVLSRSGNPNLPCRTAPAQPSRTHWQFECLRGLRTSHSHGGTSARCTMLRLPWPELPSSALPSQQMQSLPIPVALGLCRWLRHDTRRNGA